MQAAADSSSMSIFAWLQDNESTSQLVTLIQAAQLQSALSDPSAELTLFAPTNDAIAALPAATRQALPGNPQLLTQVRTTNVATSHPHSTVSCGKPSYVRLPRLCRRCSCTCRSATRCRSKRVEAGATPTHMHARRPQVRLCHSTCRVQVLQLHVVPTAAMAADLSDGQMLPTLGPLGNLTVSIAGGNVMIDAPKNGTSATVTDADNMAGAGVIHLIDGVLVPGDAAVPGLMGGAAAGGASMAPAPAPAGMNMTMTVDDTILAYVRNQDGLSTLAQLIETAGLADALNDPTSELTLFAPNNAAFAQLPPATLQALPSMTDLLAQVRPERACCRPLTERFIHRGPVLRSAL